MRIGVVGKGGVGKTTVAALLSRVLAGRGARVLAGDTDSNPNLGLSLGLSFEEVEHVPQLPRSAIAGAGGGIEADTLVRDYGRPTPAGVTLLSALRVTEAGGGCTCGGHATVRSLLGEALEAHADVTVVDMEAGLEHLSRSGGTLAHADVLVVVMEPSRKAVLTAGRTQTLALELGIPRVVGLGNKVRDDADRVFLTEACRREGGELLAVLPHAADVTEADRNGGALDRVPEADEPVVPVPTDTVSPQRKALEAERKQLKGILGDEKELKKLVVNELVSDSKKYGDDRRTLIVVFLRGAADGLTLVAPVADDNYHKFRPRLAVKKSNAVPLDDMFGLHPNLRALEPAVPWSWLGSDRWVMAAGPPGRIERWVTGRNQSHGTGIVAGLATLALLDTPGRGVTHLHRRTSLDALTPHLKGYDIEVVTP